MVFDYSDDIHFVGAQLDHYCGKDCWPYSLCAEIVEVSTTTVRKYYNELWEGDEKYREAINKAFQSIDFSKNEIKKLTYSEYDYILASKSTIKKFPKKEQDCYNKVEKELGVQELNIKTPISNSYNWSNNSGLYLLANIVCVPTRPNEKYYLIKVGKSTHLQNRISSYKGMNPFAVCVDVKLMPKEFIDDSEKQYHAIMGEKWIRESNTEWFVVPKEEYIKIVEKGFAAL